MKRTIRPRRHAAGLAVAVVTGAAVFAGTAVPASAAINTCAEDANTTQPFAAWGDQNQYRPMPGGVFTATGTPWSLSGGASVAAGADPLAIEPASQSGVLVLPAGASATSPATCFDVNDPTVRFMQDGGPNAYITAQFTYTFQSPSLTGGPNVTFQTISPPKTYSATTAGWAPSAIIDNGAQFLQQIVGGLASTVSLDSISMTLTASGGPVSVDDVYLDPMGRW